MGKPSSSCLKIIACGSDSPVDDDTEAKGSADKRGWSFRKRSARHRVLSNNVTTESLSLANKEVPQLTSIPSQAAVNTSISEKVVALEQPDEKQPPPSSNEVKLPKYVEPELSEISDPAKPSIPIQPIVSETLYTKPQDPVESEVSEAELAPKSLELGEQETYDTVIGSEVIDKVAVESLVPIESKTSQVEVTPELPATIEPEFSQIEVTSSPDSLEEEEPVELDIQTDVRGSLAETELLKQKSIVKLQAAIRGYIVRRQAVDTLYCMQGIVKVQNLVKARYSNPSADKVLASQSSVEMLLNNAFARKLLKSTPKSKSTVMKCDPLKPSPSSLWLERWMDLYTYGLANLEKVDIMTEDEQSQLQKVAPEIDSENFLTVKPEGAVKEVSVTLENGKSSINPDPREEYQTPIEQPCGSKDTSFEGPIEETPILENEGIQPSFHFQTQSTDLSVETEDLSTKSISSKQVEVESKKLAHVSRKSSNPSFVAAQSKFEELSSTCNFSGSLGSTFQASTAESDIKEKEPSGADSLLPFDMRANMAGSENGTELSVTSALDSPYLSESEAVEVDLEVKIVEEKSSNLVSNKSLEVEAKGFSPVHESDSLSAAIDGPASDLLVDNSSPRASPSNNNSHRTPSSHSSGKVKKSKVDKKTPAKPHDDLGAKSSGKKTPAKPLDDSAAKSSGKRTPTKPLDGSGGKSSGKKTPNNSAEHSSKDHHKSERRRNSFGSAKSDNVDQEPRDSTSSTKIVPSYMQATKSARAKATSPRSSPDVHDSDPYILKKRHSLPGAGGRQGSPRVEHPQSVKGNANNTPPQERKWVR